MFKIFQNNKGFSLIEILVVVIIIAILVAIAVPIYMRYVEKARSTEAQQSISALRNCYNVYYQQYGTTEGYSVEEALKDAKFGKSTSKNWEFEVVGNPPKKFIATSTADFSAGEGKQVYYDVDEAKFHGYGIDDYTGDNEDATSQED